mgnify:FL=1
MVTRIVAATAGPGISFACGNYRHDHRTAALALCCARAVYVTERSAVWHPCAACGVVLIHRDEVLCSECDETCVEGPREGAIGGTPS